MLIQDWEPSTDRHILRSRLNEFLSIPHTDERLDLADCEHAHADAEALIRAEYEEDFQPYGTRWAIYCNRRTSDIDLRDKVFRHANRVKNRIQTEERLKQERIEHGKKSFLKAAADLTASLQALEAITEPPFQIEDVRTRSAESFTQMHESGLHQAREKVRGSHTFWQKQLQTIDAQHKAAAQLKSSATSRMLIATLDILETNAKRHLEACKTEHRLIDEELARREEERKREREAQELLTHPQALLDKVEALQAEVESLRR